jgi:hypothetical protein
MSDGEMLFIGLVIAAFVIFAATLLFVSERR